MENKTALSTLEHLSRCSLFTNIPSDSLTRLLNAGSKKHLNSREVVFNRGEPGRKIYFLLDGGVKVSTLSLEGKEIIFDVLVTGDFFGEMSIFDDKPRTGTVTALASTTLFMLDKTEFLDFLEHYPAISVRLIRTLVNRLRQMDVFMEDVIFLDAEARLAKRVVALARLFGRQGQQGEVAIDLKVSQQEFANLVGVTRESVNKQFREWEKQKVVSLDKGCLTLTQPHFFEAMAAKSD